MRKSRARCSRGGDWVIPHLNGLAYIEKPPLQYWATRLEPARVRAERVRGAPLHGAAARSPPLAVVGSLARRLWGIGGGLAGGRRARRACCCSSRLGQLLTLDMSLTLYMTCALAGFLLAQSGARRPSERRWMLLAWAAAALGVLTKGLDCGGRSRRRCWCSTACMRATSRPGAACTRRGGLPLFAGDRVPWHWLAATEARRISCNSFSCTSTWQAIPDAERRSRGGVVVLRRGVCARQRSRGRCARCASWPWAGAARAPRGQFNPSLFLWIWVVFVCVFFSLSDSKLIPYILPAMPALALLIAGLPARSLERDVLAHGARDRGRGDRARDRAACSRRASSHASDRSAYFLSLAKPVAQIAALLAVSGLYVLSQRREVTRAAVFLGVGWCLSGLLMMRAAAALAPVYSGVTLARALPVVPRAAPLYSVGTYDQTLPFYWRRTFTLVAYRGELDYGLKLDPGAELAERGAIHRAVEPGIPWLTR